LGGGSVRGGFWSASRRSTSYCNNTQCSAATKPIHLCHIRLSIGARPAVAAAGPADQTGPCGRRRRYQAIDQPSVIAFVARWLRHLSNDAADHTRRAARIYAAPTQSTSTGRFYQFITSRTHATGRQHYSSPLQCT